MRFSISRSDCASIAETLQQLGAIGSDKAIHRSVLVARSGLGDRRVRAIVAQAPAYGIPIASSGSGYFVAIDAADLQRAERECSSRIRQLAKREQGYRKQRLALEYVHATDRLF